MLLTATRLAFALFLAAVVLTSVGTGKADAFQDANVLPPDAITAPIPEPVLPNGANGTFYGVPNNAYYGTGVPQPQQYGVPQAYQTPQMAPHYGHSHAAPVMGGQVYGGQNVGVGSTPPYGAPGGYGARTGSPYYYSTGGASAAPAYYGPQQYAAPSYVMPQYGVSYGGYGMNGGAGGLYARHFGPGFYRNSEYGHYRFPYYSYRRPWYHPGPPSFHRDTNLAW